MLSVHLERNTITQEKHYLDFCNVEANAHTLVSVNRNWTAQFALCRHVHHKYRAPRPFCVFTGLFLSRIFKFHHHSHTIECPLSKLNKNICPLKCKFWIPYLSHPSSKLKIKSMLQIEFWQSWSHFKLRSTPH